MDSGGNQPGDMRDIRHQHRPAALGDFAEPLEIEGAGVGARARHDQLRPVLLGQARDLIVIDPAGLTAHPVEDGAVDTPRKIQRMTVRKVAPVCKAHGENRIPGFQGGEVDRHVGLGAGMGLDVGMLDAEERLGPRNGQRLDDVHVLAAAVIPLPRQPLGVLVGEEGSLGLEDRLARIVLRGDQDHLLLLAPDLILDGLKNLGVGVF